MQKSDLAFTMAVRPCDFDDDELEKQPPDWDAVRCVVVERYAVRWCCM